ncbi:MAG: hypothetical protein KIT27_10100 [Legionellales bacterium]|nr:hypothetical protein [Legionellales bacterium]
MAERSESELAQEAQNITALKTEMIAEAITTVTIGQSDKINEFLKKKELTKNEKAQAFYYKFALLAIKDLVENDENIVINEQQIEAIEKFIGANLPDDLFALLDGYTTTLENADKKRTQTHQLFFQQDPSTHLMVAIYHNKKWLMPYDVRFMGQAKVNKGGADAQPEKSFTENGFKRVLAESALLKAHETELVPLGSIALRASIAESQQDSVKIGDKEFPVHHGFITGSMNAILNKELTQEELEQSRLVQAERDFRAYHLVKLLPGLPRKVSEKVTQEDVESDIKNLSAVRETALNKLAATIDALDNNDVDIDLTKLKTIFDAFSKAYSEDVNSKITKDLHKQFLDIAQKGTEFVIETDVEVAKNKKVKLPVSARGYQPLMPTLNTIVDSATNKSPSFIAQPAASVPYYVMDIETGKIRLNDNGKHTLGYLTAKSFSPSIKSMAPAVGHDAYVLTYISSKGIDPNTAAQLIHLSTKPQFSTFLTELNNSTLTSLQVKGIINGICKNTVTMESVSDQLEKQRLQNEEAIEALLKSCGSDLSVSSSISSSSASTSSSSSSSSSSLSRIAHYTATFGSFSTSNTSTSAGSSSSSSSSLTTASSSSSSSSSSSLKPSPSSKQL